MQSFLFIDWSILKVRKTCSTWCRPQKKSIYFRPSSVLCFDFCSYRSWNDDVHGMQWYRISSRRFAQTLMVACACGQNGMCYNPNINIPHKWLYSQFFDYRGLLCVRAISMAFYFQKTFFFLVSCTRVRFAML